MTLKKRNIVFILADQLRADFLSCYGADFIETPNLDRLAREGILYREAVSPSPVCVPARASLLTGYNAVKNGVLMNHGWLRPDHSACGMPAWPEVLATNGYHTEAIGKMHFYPWDIMEGFKHRVISEDKRHIHIEDDYFEYLKAHGLKKLHAVEMEGYAENRGAAISPVPPEHQVDTWVGDRAVEFIEGYEGDGPFALMVGFPGPHCPYDPPREWADEFNPEDMPASIPVNEDSMPFVSSQVQGLKQPWCRLDLTVFNETHKKRIRAHYAALVKNIDKQVGRMIQALTQKGIYDQTAVIFSADHGDYLGDHGLLGKGTYYDASTRVPIIVRASGVKGGQIVDSVVSLTDVHATIMHFAGIEEGLEGGDSRVLTGIGGSDPREYVFGCGAGGFMVYDGRWKLARYSRGITMLFDRGNDLQELDNLAYKPEYAEVQKRLDSIMQQEVIRSYVVGASHSLVDGAEHVVTLDKEDEDARKYFARGWKRTYPNSDVGFSLRGHPKK